MRNSILLLPLISLLYFGCGNSKPSDGNGTGNADSAANKEIVSPPEPDHISQAQLDSIFESRGVTGTIVVQQVKIGTRYVHNPSRAKERFIPASTFKIPNSLIALQEGSIGNVDEKLKWDGEERQIKIWNQDHNMRTGIEHSVVWYYQEMARRTGETKMQAWLDSIGYGNQNIGGGIDRFWLDGELRISAEEQIEFLNNLYRDKLPFRQEVMDSVKSIMLRDQGPDWKLRAKTGWGIRIEPEIGWYVGWLEKTPETWLFALNMNMEKDEDMRARIDIVYDVFRVMGFIEDK